MKRREKRNFPATSKHQQHGQLSNETPLTRMRDELTAIIETGNSPPTNHHSHHQPSSISNSESCELSPRTESTAIADEISGYLDISSEI